MNLALIYRDINNRVVHKVELLQTPTNLTYKALDSNNPKVVYLDWVKDLYEEEKWIFINEYQKLKDAQDLYGKDYNEEWYAI